MCTHEFRRVPDQRGNYNSAAHESLRAVGRCLCLHFSAGHDRFSHAIYAMGVDHVSDLTEHEANWTRKFLERLLP